MTTPKLKTFDIRGREVGSVGYDEYGPKWDTRFEDDPNTFVYCNCNIGECKGLPGLQCKEAGKVQASITFPPSSGKSLSGLVYGSDKDGWKKVSQENIKKGYDDNGQK